MTTVGQLRVGVWMELSGCGGDNKLRFPVVFVVELSFDDDFQNIQGPGPSHTYFLRNGVG